jgi:hypothetical protein
VDETGLDGVYDIALDLSRYFLDPQTGKPILDSRGAIDHEGALIDHVEKDPTGN